MPSLRLPLAFLLLLSIGGCTEPVREDRNINWSKDGEGVGFQHGEEGVFVAGENGRRLTKIFDPTEDVIATSPPLWSPVDKRLIFTTARPANTDRTDSRPTVPDWDSSPEGRVFTKTDIIYTCMLRDAPGGPDGAAPEPVGIFQAACDHVGYVAANLAAGWHPDGKRILFVDRAGRKKHSLFEYHLQTKKVRRVLELSADALTFGWTPSGSFLVCVTANQEPQPEGDGIWIRPADDGACWWRVPGSEDLAQGDFDSQLERLRSTQPAWTPDDRRFAFVTYTPGEKDEEPGNTSISVVEVSSRIVTKVYETTHSVKDLCWHPRDGCLGFVCEGDEATLQLIDGTGAVSTIESTGPVRRFAGWNSKGTRLAYITPDDVPTHREDNWAVLLPPVRHARDRVFVADGAGSGPGKQVHSGMRVTFPQWSPSDDKLSLWFTYSPTHRCWLSSILPWSLRPGDPAAILDCRSGTIAWMAVNAHEQSQVGHFFLLKRDYKQAWEWYEKTAQSRTPPEPFRFENIDQLARRLRAYQDTSIFEHHCLTKLGRTEEAEAKLRQFRRTMCLDLSGFEPGEQWAAWQAEGMDLKNEIQSLADCLTPLVQDMYIAEVYLSLDAPTDGVAFFQRSLAGASTGHERLGHALCLSQMLLLTEQHASYARLATETLAPLLLKLKEPVDAGNSDDARDFSEVRKQTEQGVLIAFGGSALLPMFSSRFLATIPDAQLERHLNAWEELHPQTNDEHERLAIDLFLHAALTTLDRCEQRRTVEQRLGNNPTLSEFFGEKGLHGIADAIDEARHFAW